MDLIGALEFVRLGGVIGKYERKVGESEEGSRSVVRRKEFVGISRFTTVSRVSPRMECDERLVSGEGFHETDLDGKGVLHGGF